MYMKVYYIVYRLDRYKFHAFYLQLLFLMIILFFPCNIITSTSSALFNFSKICPLRHKTSGLAPSVQSWKTNGICKNTSSTCKIKCFSHMSPCICTHHTFPVFGSQPLTSSVRARAVWRELADPEWRRIWMWRTLTFLETGPIATVTRRLFLPRVRAPVQGK